MNYKVTKIGLINFWYFDEEEFHFSDGKVLLRGENGSGKSVTMQSFIPLILDGNKAPSRLDPFGSKEKRIEDYLLGPSDGMQKDDATGYLYMEVYKEQLDKYITIGMGLRARKGQGTDFFGFALKDGKRIGIDFLLYKDYSQKVLLTKKELKARLGTTNEFVETTKEYKKMVNDLLFGFKELDAYDEFINVLLQLRSSKLSKEYTPTKLMGILSSVLQPLTEDDIRPISEAIEDTNKTREKIEILEKQVKSLGNLLKTYQNYNEIILYHKASNVSEKKKLVRNRENEITKEEKTIGEIESRLEEIKSKLEFLEKEYLDHAARLEVIDDKDLKKCTEDLANIEDEMKRISIDIETIKSKLEGKLSQEKKVENEITTYENRVYEDEKELIGICDDISSFSDEIKLTDISMAVRKISKREDANFVYLKDRVSKYKTKVNQIKIKLEEKEKLEIDLNRVEEDHLRYKKDEEEKEKELRKEEKVLKDKIDALKDAINVLDKSNQIIKIDRAGKDKIFSLIHEYSPNNYLLAKAEYGTIAKYYEEEATNEKSNIINKKKVAEQELDILKEELTFLRSQKELEIEEDEEVVRVFHSLQIPYIPFYKVVEFQDTISDEEKNRLEELLNSMNILNAYIVPTKYLNATKNINATFLKRGTKKGHNLSRYLKALENEIVSKDEITAILESISTDQQDDIYLSPDSYCFDFMLGYPGEKYEYKYIGILKRIEEQKRKVEAKEKEISSKEELILNYQNLLNNIKKKIEQIRMEMNQFPQNENLEQSRVLIHDIEIELDILMRQDRNIVDKITDITKQIELKIAEINQMKEHIMIPLNLASYKEALQLVDELTGQIYRLESVCKRLQLNQEQKEMNQNRLEEVRQEIAYQNEELSHKSKSLYGLSSKKKALDETLANPDYQKLIDELQKITERQKQIPEEKMHLAGEQGNLQSQLATLADSLTEHRNLLDRDYVELELLEMILKREYDLHYVYQEDTLDLSKILNDLEGRKNHDVTNALTNYLQAYNEYRLDLLEYRLNTKEIFSINDEIVERYVEKGLDESFVEKLLKTAIRQDMTSIYQGRILNLYVLEECLKSAITESESYITKQERHLFEDVLLKTVGNKIRDKIESSKEWVSKMNEIMKNTQVDSNLSFQLEWKSKVAFTEDELDTKELVRLFKIDAGQLTRDDSEKLSNHFRSQIKKELEYSDNSNESYTSIISRVLDYRNWFEFKLYYQRKSGEKKELTNKVFFVLSGGERAKSMYVPLFASVYAKLLTARKDSLRLIALDEAFAGVDNSNVREMFAILSQLNLDYILTSQALWGDYDTIQEMSICELIKDEVRKAVAVRHYHWNGHVIKLLERTEESVEFE